MTRSLFTVARILMVLAGVLSLLAVMLAPGPTRSFAAAVAPTATHPYSDPVWLPVRVPARVGCTKVACDNGPAHGFFAIDFTGKRNDPIYAAGAGIAHIGGNSGGCSTTSSVERGRWVWVDHGAGVVTHYRHLNAITVSEGARVTPETMVGKMGASGDIAPCTGNYLHFEVRHGGTTGVPVDPGQLKTCVNSQVVSVPAIYGATSWDDPLVHPKSRLYTPTATGSCIGSPWLSTPAAPKVTATRGDRSATVTWTVAPRGVDSVMVLFESWHPSINRWGTPVFRRLPATTTTTVFTGLENGKTYRASATFHGSTGNGVASPRHEVRPAAVPGAPGSPRYLTWPQRDYVHYGWHRPARNGSDVTSFTAARRCRVGKAPYGAWRTYRQGTKDTFRNFRGLTSYSACEVKVRAQNEVGSGPYSRTSTIKR